MTKKQSDIINCETPTGRVILDIQSYIDATETNLSHYEEKGFDKRVEVIDFIDFHIIYQIECLLQKAPQSPQLISLKHRAKKVKAKLEGIDITLFKKLRENIRTKRYAEAGFKNLVNEYVDLNVNQHPDDPCYDNLDIFINGLFPVKTMPKQTRELEAEMVFYQKTPARIIFELVERSDFTKDDVFVDLGSGLGQVAILVNLLAGIKTRGVEFEPAFCDYARDCAAALNLPNVTFINVDARKANYTDGTIFFMFTPFKGEVMQEVLEHLKKEALTRKITIITYGPCTVEVALQNWLIFAHPQDANIYKPGFFTSF